MLLIAPALENTLKLIGLFIVFILIIAACYMITRFIGNQQLGLPRKSNFKLLDAMRLGQNQSLMLVKVGKRFFCLAVSKDNVSTVCELTEEEFEDFNVQTSGASFSNVFASVLKKKKAEESEAEVEKTSLDEEK